MSSNNFKKLLIAALQISTTTALSSDARKSDLPITHVTVHPHPAAAQVTITSAVEGLTNAINHISAEHSSAAAASVASKEASNLEYFLTRPTKVVTSTESVYYYGPLETADQIMTLWDCVRPNGAQVETVTIATETGSVEGVHCRYQDYKTQTDFILPSHRVHAVTSPMSSVPTRSVHYVYPVTAVVTPKGHRHHNPTRKEHSSSGKTTSTERTTTEPSKTTRTTLETVVTKTSTTTKTKESPTTSTKLSIVTSTLTSSLRSVKTKTSVETSTLLSTKTSVETSTVTPTTQSSHTTSHHHRSTTTSEKSSTTTTKSTTSEKSTKTQSPKTTSTTTTKQSTTTQKPQSDFPRPTTKTTILTSTQTTTSSASTSVWTTFSTFTTVFPSWPTLQSGDPNMWSSMVGITSKRSIASYANAYKREEPAATRIITRNFEILPSSLAKPQPTPSTSKDIEDPTDLPPCEPVKDANGVLHVAIGPCYDPPLKLTDGRGKMPEKRSEGMHDPLVCASLHAEEDSEVTTANGKNYILPESWECGETSS